MTWTVDHPHRRTIFHHRARVHRVRLYHPLGVAGMGILTALLGAWAALVGFVGPEFGYQATNNASWQWTTANWLLHLIPGAVAFVAGLAAVALAGATTLGGRTLLRLTGLVIVAAGAWLVIGPALWPVFESGSPYGSAATAQTSFTHQIGANLGPGLLLVALGAMIYEAVSARRLAPAYEGPAGAVGGPTGAVVSPTGAVENPAAEETTGRAAEGDPPEGERPPA
jgi:type IV secretory pathway VirB2 component (pilin)